MKYLLIIPALFIYLFGFSQINVQVPKLSKLDAELIKLVSDPDLKNASIGFYAIDLETKKVIGKKNEELSLIPASTLKTVTTATALHMLGERFRFKTELQYTGSIDSNGVLKGDIIIKGGGDPTLGSERFTKYYYNPYFIDLWCDSIKAAGIKKIEGSVIADKTMYRSKNSIPATWIWGDIANYYGAGVFALSVFENLYKIHFQTGAISGDSAHIISIQPKVPGLIMKNYVTASNTYADNSYIYGGIFDNYRIIEGTIPKNRKDFVVKGSIPDPPLLVAEYLYNSLEKNSVSISGAYQTTDNYNIADSLERKSICYTLSPALIDIIYVTNMVSHNMFADHMLAYLGYKKYGCGDFVSGTKAVETYWQSKGIDTQGMYLNDGSGLSRYDAITTKQIVDILSYTYHGVHKDSYKKTLPVAGVSGTLAGSCKGTNAVNRIFAKSGSMSRIRSCAGYVETIHNKKIAFAIIVNNFNCSSYQMRLKIDKILVALAEYPD